MKHPMKITSIAALAVALSATACTGAGAPGALDRRAYVVSEESDDVFVVDLDEMAPVGRVDTKIGPGVNANHMAVLSPDAATLYVVATHHDAVVAVDAATLEITGTIDVGAHPTHASMCAACPPHGRDELWVVNEDDGSISVVDAGEHRVTDTIADDSMVVPHFVRFSDDAAYVPSIGGNQITVVDLDSRGIRDVLTLEGADTGACSGDPCGFADAQIDAEGVLLAAHIESGRLLSYDTGARQRLPDAAVGQKPWAAFADPDGSARMVPNWGDASVSILGGMPPVEVARSAGGDAESYGVNFSPLAPEVAFVMNRVRERVSVIDRDTGDVVDALEVGGTTETASTTADGRHLLLPLSSSDELLVLDVTTREEVARFAGVGDYPWSVTTAGGQNYCH